MSCPTKIEIKSIAGYLEDKKIVSEGEQMVIKQRIAARMPLRATAPGEEELWSWVDKTEGFEMSRELYKKFKVWVDNGCKSGTVDSSALEKLRKDYDSLKTKVEEHFGSLERFDQTIEAQGGGLSPWLPQ
jgi:hypothetical protein